MVFEPFLYVQSGGTYATRPVSDDNQENRFFSLKSHPRNRLSSSDLRVVLRNAADTTTDLGEQFLVSNETCISHDGTL